MSKIKIILSIFIFSTLLIFTSIIKTQTRIIEKKIHKVEKKIELLKKDFHETQLDFFYITSPENLNNKVKLLRVIDYIPMDFSRISTMWCPRNRTPTAAMQTELFLKHMYNLQCVKF